MSNAITKKNFYIIPKDKRDLNYDKYFEKGHGELKILKNIILQIPINYHL